MPGTPRSLEDVAKLDLLSAEEPSRVRAIWEAFHEDRPGVAGCTLDAAEHGDILQRGSESPMFVYPIRRGDGHFMLLSQFSAASAMFAMTFLEDYRKNPEMAQPWASVHLFDELLAPKGVGLLRAEVQPERLTNDEAAHLLLLVRRFYGTQHYDKVWSFNHAQRHFDLDKHLLNCP